jgi:hypothetical protein
MEFNNLVDSILNNLNEGWEKGTSKAPKGKSYDMSRGGAPSNVNAASDGSGGRYRRTRPPSARSNKTHSEMEESKEIKIGSTIITNYNEEVVIKEIDKTSDKFGRTIYIGETDDGEERFLYPDQIRAVSPEEEAEGKIDKDRMKCNKPRRTSGGSKKFVVKACKDGKEKIVRYGDPNMKIKKSNPKRRKSFRARHKCDQKKDKFSAGYWSCKKW